MKCCICYEELASPDAVCTGRLPGAFGLVQFSPGPCRSTPERRQAVDEHRRQMAKTQKGVSTADTQA